MKEYQFVKKPKKKKESPHKGKSLEKLRDEAIAFNMILDGVKPSDVRKAMVEAGCSTKIAEVIVKDVLHEIQNLNEVEVAELVRVHIDRYEDIYRRCIERRQPKLAMACLLSKEKLLGLHQPLELEVFNNKFYITDAFNLDNLSKAQRDRMTELLDKADYKPEIKTIPIELGEGDES